MTGTESRKIPKIIHYCWFGKNPLPDQVKQYISTWEKYCPDYEIKQWNEDNFDVTQNDYCKEAYEAKKWAFVSDYARLKIMYDYGGIYMDTDVELVKSLDDLLQYKAFSGFEESPVILTSTMGACKSNEWINYLLSYYLSRHFLRQDRTYDLTTNVDIITRMTKDKYDIKLDGSKQIFGDEIIIFPFDFLCAKSDRTFRIHRTKNTYTIHHFAHTWFSDRQQQWIEKYKVYSQYFSSMPTDIAHPLTWILTTCKVYSISEITSKIIRNIKI